MRKAFLHEANLRGADLKRANLREADLTMTTLAETDFTGATLTGAHIYGASVWNVKLEDARQDDLVITKDGEPVITVDNLEVAQFIYLLLNNEKIRDILDTIAKKGVLILGRFTDDRKVILDAIQGSSPRTWLRADDV